jgi:magnesium-transporting ATPase (P-type)
LIWLGLMGMVDPIRKGVKDAIGSLHHAEIDTVMITGDQSPTAYAIAKELNLSRNGPLEILDSTQLAPIDPDVLQALSSRVHVFARVSPAHKLQDEPIMQSADLQRIAFESTVLSAGALSAYGYGLMRYGIGPQASTMAFTSLTIGQLLHAISCRSETHRVLSAEPLSPNRYLNLALLGSFTVKVLALVVPGLRSLLGIAPIDLLDSLVIGGSALFPLVVNEASKSLGAKTVSDGQAIAG